jgi:hypothetical protein
VSRLGTGIPRKRSDECWEVMVSIKNKYGSSKRVPIYGKTYEECNNNKNLYLEHILPELADAQINSTNLKIEKSIDFLKGLDKNAEDKMGLSVTLRYNNNTKKTHIIDNKGYTLCCQNTKHNRENWYWNEEYKGEVTGCTCNLCIDRYIYLKNPGYGSLESMRAKAKAKDAECADALGLMLTSKIKNTSTINERENEIMVIKHDDTCTIKYLKYLETTISVISVNRKTKLIPVNPILSITKYYGSTPIEFINQKQLKQGIDWEKLGDSELTRISAIKREDGYSKIPNSTIYFTCRGLETYLIAWTCKTNHLSKPVDNKFVKFCENYILDNKMNSAATAAKEIGTVPTHTEALIKFRENNKYLDLKECSAGLVKVYDDLRGATEIITKFTENMAQFKGFLMAMQKDSAFVDEFLYSLDFYKKSHEELKVINDNIGTYINNADSKYKSFITNVMQKTIEDLLAKSKAI